MQRQTLEEAFDATFLQEGSVEEILDEILPGEEGKKSKKKRKKEKKVELSELITTIPFEASTLTMNLSSLHNTNDPFKQWLYRQKEKDRIISRERFIVRECRKQEDLRLKEKREWSKQTFELWKFRKDLEAHNSKKLQLDIEKMLESLKTKPKTTDTLPGYISTWSCDTQLAKKMQKVCPRGTQSL